MDQILTLNKILSAYRINTEGIIPTCAFSFEHEILSYDGVESDSEEIHHVRLSHFDAIKHEKC